ncbi:MAG: hypothetical protein HY553_20755 [Elusimicrobia bacterium]|nr:hypothetical protein [Elusimicrobiota bacterium]
MTDDAPDNRRRNALIAACIALLLVFAFYAGRSRRDRPELVRSGPATAESDPRLLRWPDSRRSTMSFDEFLAVFRGVDQQPAARRFVDAFRREPKLRAAWERLENTKNVARFIAELKEGAEFRRLAAEHGRDPAFKALVETALERAPSLQDLLQAGPEPAAASPESLVRSPREFTPSAPKLPSLPGRDRRSATQAAVGARFSGSGAPGGTGPSDFSGKTADGPGDAAHGVRAGLVRPEDAATEGFARLLEMYPWLGKLTEEERRRLLAQIDRDGLWGACFRLDLYGRCREACADSDGQCRPVSGWKSCLDAHNGDEDACRAACPLQPGCTPPGGTTGGVDPGDGGTDGTDGGPEDPCAGIRVMTPSCVPPKTPKWNPQKCRYDCRGPTMACMITPTGNPPPCPGGGVARWSQTACRYVCSPPVVVD